MYYLRIPNKKKRIGFAKFEYKRILLRALSTNEFFPVRHRVRAAVLIDNYSRFNSLSKIRKRCKITGRGNGLVSKFAMSRMAFHRLAGDGKIVGIRRSTW